MRTSIRVNFPGWFVQLINNFVLSRNEVIPEPFIFNYWKHHFGFLIEAIREMHLREDTFGLKQNLKKIGNSTTDLYTGEISISEITDYCFQYLGDFNLLGKTDYLDWINSSGTSYREVIFPDRSVWVFKKGTEPNRHIHIHPGRNAPHTTRVKANVLKTAITANLISLIEDTNPLHIKTVNRVRMEFIDLDPVKFITLNQELGRVINAFAEQLDIKT